MSLQGAVRTTACLRKVRYRISQSILQNCMVTFIKICTCTGETLHAAVWAV